MAGRYRTLGAVMVAAAAMAACGDAADDGAAAPAPTVTVTVTATPQDHATGSASPSPTPTPTAEPTGGAGDDPCAGDALDEMAFIFVTSPHPGAEFPPGTTVEGCSNVFEATHEWELLDRDGAVLADGFGTASCGTGCVGTFDFEVDHDVDERQTGTLRVFASSPRDGSETHVNAIPVILTP